ncbi:MAG: hypothetical protein ACE5HV_11105 [Acidobacteriota bacterium]
MNEDFQDILATLLEAGARFLVVGAHAMAVHGVPRATGDLDIWIEPTADNVEQVWSALVRFGAPVESLGISLQDFLKPGSVIQIGVPPRRIDILTDITGVDFKSAWESRAVHSVEDLRVPFVGRETLVQNKQATGRLKDLADLEALEEKES